MSDLEPTHEPSDGSTEIFGGDAEQVKSSIAPARAAAQRKLLAAQAEIDAAKAELKRRRDEAEAAFRAQQAELEAQMAPLRAELEKLTEVAWTVDLYLGRDETVELLVDGEPAPADTPITIRQNVLAADEESLALLEAGGIDATRMDAFLDWVAASPANRDRIIPDARGVVAVMPSRQDRDYGHAIANSVMDKANQQTYWLLRNGERLYVMTTDFLAGDRILPTETEFLDYFHTHTIAGEQVPMVPGSKQWIQAEQAADARRRHFMRAMLILQGHINCTKYAITQARFGGTLGSRALPRPSCHRGTQNGKCASYRSPGLSLGGGGRHGRRALPHHRMVG